MKYIEFSSIILHLVCLYVRPYVSWCVLVRSFSEKIDLK